MKKLLPILITIFSMSFVYGQDTASSDADSFAKEYLDKARLFGDTGDFDNAVRFCNMAFEIAADKLPVYKSRSTYLFLDKKYEKAIVDYTSIIELAPENSAIVYFQRGISKLLLNRDLISDACSDIQKAKALGYSEEGETFNKLCDKI